MRGQRPTRARGESLPGVWTGEHLPGLDGLRGLAVVGVLAFHDGRLTGGWLGVDLFFTLSGFLIVSLLLAEVHRYGAVDLRAFWGRRARRLLPAVLALVAVLVTWGHVAVGAPWASTDVRGASIATLGYVANWYEAFAGSGYWAQFAVASPLRHTWSLAIEEQFYLVFPLVAWAIARRSRRPTRALLAASIVGIVASVASLLVLGRSDTNLNRIYLGTDTRAASILFGAVLAVMLARRPPRAGVGSAADRWLPDGVALGAVAALALLWWQADGRGRFVADGGLLLHAALVVAVIAVVVRRPDTLVARGLAWAPLARLGTISYGLYLWHWPVFLYVDERLQLPALLATAVKLGVSLALAELSMLLVERPARQEGAAFLGGRLPTASVAGLLLLGAVLLPAARPLGGAEAVLAGAPRSLEDLGAVAPPPASGPSAPTRAPQGRSPTGTDVPRLQRNGEPAGRQPVLERSGRLPGPLRLAVLGDSVGFLLGDQLVKDQDRFGLVVVNRALPACSLGAPDQSRVADGLLPPAADCAGLWRDDAATFDPDLVVVSVNGDVGVEHRYGDTWGTTCSDGYQRAARERLEQRLTAFSDRGARVFILTPLINGRASVRLASTPQNVGCLERLEGDVARRTPGIELLQMGEWICPDLRADCRATIAGVSMFRVDRMHFVGRPARNVWSAILPTMLADASG